MTEFQITQRGAGYAPDIASVDGFDFDVHSEPDDGTRPHDYDCYDGATRTAWLNDDWRYVGVIVTTSIDGVELGSASLWGIEEGHLPGIDRYITPFRGDVLQDLAHDALAEARVNANAIAHVIGR